MESRRQPDHTGFDRFHAMGTLFEFFIVSHDDEAIADDFLLARELVRRYELALSFHAKESELSQLNQQLKQSSGPIACSPLLGNALAIALTGRNVSDGAFDPCYRSPNITFEMTKQADHWALQASTRGLVIDLGGIGKGIVADALRTVFDKPYVTGSLLSLGGSTFLATGTRPDGRAWRVGSEIPSLNLSFNLTDASLSFSSTKKRGDLLSISAHATETSSPHITAAATAISAAWAEIASTAILMSLSNRSELPSEIHSHILDHKYAFHD